MPAFRPKNKFKLKRNMINLSNNKHVPTKFQVSYIVERL